MEVTRPVTRGKLNMGCGYGVFIFLLFVGLLFLGSAFSKYQRTGGLAGPVLPPGIVGVGLVLGSLAYLAFARRQVRENEAELDRQARFPGQPWKWKREWSGPAIESKQGAATAGLWFFTVLWNATGWAAAIVILGQERHQPGVYLILLFPAVGLLVLWAAIYQTIRARKFGRVRFVPSSLPGVIGGYLGGVIDVAGRVVPEGDAKLSLKCLRRETRGSGKNRRTSDVFLWEHEESIPREKWGTGAGPTRIPVRFYIPPNCLATDDHDRTNEIVWRLSASAAVPGVDFATEFEVPVFATGDTAAPPEAGAPALAAYRQQVLDAAALQKCGVRREGAALHFSASHLPGTKAVLAVLQLGFFGLLAWYWGRDVPGGVWAVTIFMGLILSLFTVGVWCDKHELRVEGTDVVVTKPRPWGTKVTRVPRARVESVRTERSMSSGENQYYGLSLVGATGVNPGGPAAASEPFAVRKLRYQLEQLEKKGESTPDQRKELGDQIIAQMQAEPSFVIRFASHIPGQAKAEAIGAMVMAAIRGGKS